MDPITLAARRFQAELRSFWSEAPPDAALRLVASAADVRDMKKALRLFELEPACRRPLLLYEAPFVDEATYFAGLADQARADYEAVRKGAAEEGVELRALALAPEVEPPRGDDAAAALVRASRVVREVAELFGERLDGLDVALVPATLAEPDRWKRAVGLFADELRHARIRFAVHDAPHGPLETQIPGAAAFAVDQAELARFLKEMGPKPSAGPPVPTPALSPTKKAEAEQKLGQKIASSDAGRLLRVLLLEATEALRDGKPERAARKFRQARTLCRLDGLDRQEAVVLIAIGAAEIAAADTRSAHAAFRDAATIAERLGNTTLEVHAGLGIAGAHLAERRHPWAATAYERVAEKASDPMRAPLGIEAWRMAGVCHAASGAKADAERCFRRALELGAGLPAAERAITTFSQAVEGLVAALRAEGNLAGATDVERWALALDDPPKTAQPREGAATGGAI